MSSIWGVLVAAALALGCMPGNAQDFDPRGPSRVEDMAPVELVVAEYSPAGGYTARSWKRFAEAVTEASGGKITFRFYWSGALLSPGELAAGLAAGVADMGIVVPAYNPSDFPLSNWLAGLGSLPRGGVPFSQLYGTPAQTEFALTNPEAAAEWAGNGLQVIGATYFQAFDLLCKSPVNTLDDAAGLRVRVPGQVWAAEATALEMVPVPLLPTEMYEGFSRGVVDCVMLHPSGYVDFGLLDVSGDKYFIASEFAGFNPTYMAIGKDKWDSLPPAAQEILQKAFATYAAAHIENNLESHGQFAERAEETDIHLIEPDAAFADTLLRVQDEYLASMIETAPAELDDPGGIIDQYRSILEGWEMRVREEGYLPAPSDIEQRLESYGRQPDLRAWLDMVEDRFAAMRPQ